MSTDEECRKEFEAMCRLMGIEFSLEWDKAGFYQQLETDRCYTWFKLGFDRTKTTQIDTLVASAKNRIAHTEASTAIMDESSWYPDTDTQSILAKARTQPARKR